MSLAISKHRYNNSNSFSIVRHYSQEDLYFTGKEKEKVA